MTTPSPAEQFTDDLQSLQSKIGSLQQSARLSEISDAVEDLQTSVNGMAQRIALLRQRGYVFEKELETQAGAFVTQWAQIHPSLVRLINQQSTALQASLRPIETQLSQLAGRKPDPAARSLLESLKTSINTFEEKAQAAENQINGMYNSFQDQVNEVESQLSNIEWMLSQLAEARFSLLPTEGAIAAVKTVWCKDGKENKDDPEGVLYLTDQRLLFEQKEEIVTKKILFIPTEKQKVQELKWQIPVSLIEEIKPSKQGLLKNEDHLDLRFGPGAALQTVHIHIWQDVNYWLQLLNRAKIKDFDKTRAVAIDQAEVDKVKSLPSQCPSCGGNFDQVVLRGQSEVKCLYCGFVIRL
jgi:uncharacterized protein Smg (DUF494 family)/ribosomal protein S27E